MTVGVMLALGGCATVGTKIPSPATTVAGIWEGVFRSTIGQGVGEGDTRIEHQAWSLTQRGGTVSGYYVVEVTMISGDGRPYLCNKEPRFSTLLRMDVRG